VGGEAPVTPVSTLDSSYFNLSYKPCDNKLQYISTNEQVADVLTKPLSRVKFEYLRDKLGIVRKDLPQMGE
jgi:hypothetical protein